MRSRRSRARVGCGGSSWRPPFEQRVTIRLPALGLLRLPLLRSALLLGSALCLSLRVGFRLGDRLRPRHLVGLVRERLAHEVADGVHDALERTLLLPAG